MADQEFLASFAVDVDEAGVSRLQTVLEGNRDLASEVAAAFNAAAEAIREYEKAATGGDNPSGEANRDTGSGRLSAGSMPGERRVGSSSEQDRSGWYYAGEYDRWIPDTDSALKNFAQLQLSGILTGENTPAMPTAARELVLQNMETMFLGQATPDSDNAARNLFNWKEAGLTTNPAACEGYNELMTAAQDLIREPMEQAREYMRQAIKAEDAGESGSEYMRMVDEVLRRPLEQVKEMVDSFNFDDPSASHEGDGAGSDGGIAGMLDLESARADLAAFREEASQPVTLSANASGVTSVARAAWNSVKAIFSAPITIRVKVEVENPEVDGLTERDEVQMSAGGRFDSPAHVEVAEDGDPEYIIPVRKESKAVPLLRQLLSELSPSARASLALDESGSQLAGGLAAGMPVSAQITQNNQNVSAPVSIEVNAVGENAERIGRSVYNAAERYLLRTMKGVFA